MCDAMHNIAEYHEKGVMCNPVLETRSPQAHISKSGFLFYLIWFFEMQSMTAPNSVGKAECISSHEPPTQSFASWGHSHACGRRNPNYVYIIHNMEINNPGGGNPCMYIANNMVSESFNVAHSFVSDEHVETLQRFLDSAQVRTILPSFTFCIRKTEMKFEMWEFVKSAYEHLPCNPTRANRVC